MDNVDSIPKPEATQDPLKEIKAKLTETEKENFFKAFLADQPYIAEESLFNGKVPVKFKTLSVAESNAIMLQMQYDRDNGVAKASDAYLIQVIQYRITASLVALDNKPFATDITEAAYPAQQKEGTYLLKRLDLIKNWPVFKVSSLTDAYNRFEMKVRALTEESFKENF